MLESYTGALGDALGSRAQQIQSMLEGFSNDMAATLSARTENLQTVFEEYTRALDTTLANRAQSLDNQLIERTKALDKAFSERLRLFDESIMRSTVAIDAAVGETAALARRGARRARQELPRDHRAAGRQSRRIADARHQLRAPREREHHAPVDQGDGRPRGPVRPAEEHVGELARPDRGVTGRFENQGQQIMKAANALETAN